ncbi:uncharacterized protein KQ657_004516 [Scheffersomyces spartinae]|uniref:Uncharacterized protein n=1 Tax=Scheffersomyces spartinae TaxID=45513 RepID=A0A9P7VBI4_9ASCO|nr:uncharacterized protein KQ657_004516 [Scheffersomyces spartinae]KAG7194304.1 hypothetical protein KQ657_004516 [Scheffersomyces spartinae]
MTLEEKEEEWVRLLPQDELKNSSAYDDITSTQKLGKLKKLIQKSQVYSQIIAKDILDNLESKAKERREKDKNDKQSGKETEKNQISSPSKRRATRSTKPTNDKKPKKSSDIISMLSGVSTRSTRSLSTLIQTTSTTFEDIANPISIDNVSTLQPKLITGCVLKDYQLDGLEWLITLYENGLNGILADEMGLGKTIQCISFLSFLIEQGIKGPFLVVAPLSTVSNWYNEIKKFAPDLTAMKYIGSKEARKRMTKFEKYNIVLTSYEISIRDFNKLSRCSWNYLIIDEGHRLKNAHCQLIKFLKKLNIENRLLITGTPLQNNLDELWSLLNFILPSIFHDLDLFQQWFNFDDFFAKNAESEEDAENLQQNKQLVQAALVENLHTILKPFILRRLKSEVILNLPPKKEYLIYTPMTKFQNLIYHEAMNNRLFQCLVILNFKQHMKLNYSHIEPKEILDFISSKIPELSNESPTLSTRNEVVAYKEPDSDDEFEEDAPQMHFPIRKQKISKNDEDGINQIMETVYESCVHNIKRIKLQNLMIQLRTICNSPYVYYDPFLETEGETDNSNNDIPFLDLMVENSAKFQVLETLLNNLLPNGHKVLIFSQFTRTLDLIQDWLTIKQAIKCSRLDGSISHEVRDEEITSFQKDPNTMVFLLLTRAGGLGLNLVSGDSVVLFDSDWNPQVDLQAIDRVHRIGQTKPCKIYRLITRGTIEEILISRSCSKRFLEKLVIQLGQFKFKQLQRILEKEKDEKSHSEKVKDLINLSRSFQFEEFPQLATTKETELINDQFYDSKDSIVRFEKEEIEELFDRSDKCYARHNTTFKNITIFETINNLDK